MITKLSFF